VHLNEPGKLWKDNFPEQLVLPDTRIYFGKDETAIPNKEQVVSHFRSRIHFYLFVTSCRQE
jgi:hypothetical protein